MRVKTNLIGRVFGKLTVVGRAATPGGTSKWDCLCSCGGSSTPTKTNLLNGHSTSCGCDQGAKLLDLTGMVFGNLTVIERAHTGKSREIHWLCRCNCGNTTTPTSISLRNGNTRSCGCYRLMAIRKYPTAEYSARALLWGRYKKGAQTRGYEWGLSLEEFVEITSKPCVYCGQPPELRGRQDRRKSDVHSSGIDRVDNNRGYVPGNVAPCCTWCNTAKHSSSMMDFVAHCRAVAQQFPEVNL